LATLTDLLNYLLHMLVNNYTIV